MESRWLDRDAEAEVDQWCRKYGSTCNRDIALRTYTSRLIGREPSLVLHGGGNTSVKTELPDEFGAPCQVLCVKGSGWDLATLEPPGLPAVRFESLSALRSLPRMSDEAMVNAARTRLLDAGAPNPSVEALLHAFLPHKFVDHSHADAILSLVDQENAEALCKEAFGDTLAVVPYVMAGFSLAKVAAEIYEANPGCEGLLLIQHGLFTFGETAKESYERHIRAVDTAERFIAKRRKKTPPVPASSREDGSFYQRLSPIVRGRLGDAGKRYILSLRSSKSVSELLRRPDLDAIATRGPITPDHVIRTKARPLILRVNAEMGDDELHREVERSINQYREEYRQYFSRENARVGGAKVALDPEPRVMIIPGLGALCVGASSKAAGVAGDIYEHTASTIIDAEAVGSFRPLSDSELFDMEYWSLEQAKLGKAKPRPLSSQVVYVTGAASGIGAATAREFAAAGAHLHLVDRDGEKLAELAQELGATHQTLDVTDEAAVRESVGACVREYGGLDGVVSNAGNAPQGVMDECPSDELLASLQVNLLSHQYVAAAAVKVLKAQGMGGYLLFNASKAAFNPGKGFGPYAVAKAGLVALMKQYALECGDFGIRANAVNADRIRTGLFPDEMVTARAAARGIAVEDYFRANLLRRVVTAEDVGRGFLALALSPSTTAAVITVDGGNIAASPR